MPIKIDVREHEGDYTLHLNGELDLAAAPALESRIRPLFEDGASALTLDLSGLRFIDSTGLAAVVLANALCDKHGCRFELLQGPRQVQRLFEITGLLKALPFRDGVRCAPSG